MEVRLGCYVYNMVIFKKAIVVIYIDPRRVYFLFLYSGVCNKYMKDNLLTRSLVHRYRMNEGYKFDKRI